ncbi:MAG: DoxX family protein [Bacteroidota bacterium]
MNILLWTAQLLLALTLGWASAMKLFLPAEKLAEMWPWTADNSGLVKLTGVLDLLAAIGLILPALLRIQPKLTIYTAYALVALMIAAAIFHISRGEASQIGVNIFVVLLALFIAWGRQKKAAIHPKGM